MQFKNWDFQLMKELYWLHKSAAECINENATWK
jgi:hypothetical protein